VADISPFVSNFEVLDKGLMCADNAAAPESQGFADAPPEKSDRDYKNE